MNVSLDLSLFCAQNAVSSILQLQPAPPRILVFRILHDLSMKFEYVE